MPARPGGPFLQIDGLNDFRRDLRAMGAQLSRELNKVLKDAVDKTITPEARRRAQAMGSVQAKAAPAIRGASSAGAAKLAIGGLSRYPFAEGAFFGSIQYRQFPAWVGNDWEVGEPGQGPLAVNDAIAARADEVEEAVGDAVEDLATRTGAFPLPF